MKIRTNFVTNSSSSNFLIACKTPLNKQMLLDAFGVPETSPFYQEAENLAIQIIGASERIDDTFLYRKKNIGGNDNDFLEVALHYMNHTSYCYVYDVSLWKEYIDVIERFPYGFMNKDLAIISENKWRLNQKKLWVSGKKVED